MAVSPMMAFMGVRISWLILDRKVLLAWLATWAALRASCKSSFWRFSSLISVMSERVRRMIFL